MSNSRNLKPIASIFTCCTRLNKATWANIVLKHNLLGEAERALADGRIGHLGFSFHDNTECFEEIVNASGLWTFCQIQYNYMDIENQAGTRGLKLAAEKGLAVVAMEPLMGGRLADPPPAIRETIAADAGAAQPGANRARLGLGSARSNRGAERHEHSGPGYRKSAGLRIEARVGKLGAADQALVECVREQYRARLIIPCTQCGYCMPCPTGVDIPINLDFFNYAHTYDDVGAARFRYKFVLREGQRASACADCGTCEELCPQHIAISDWMPKVAELLG